MQRRADGVEPTTLIVFNTKAASGQGGQVAKHDRSVELVDRRPSGLAKTLNIRVVKPTA